MTNSEATISQDKQILTVSALNNQVKYLLENQLPAIWVEGEISNLSVPSSGHWYFTLKDRNAQIRAAMFRGRNRGVRFIPKNGSQVLIKGKVSLYAPRGDYQLIVDTMEEAGEGALRRAFEALKLKLSDQGLFDEERKKALPELPQQVGIITSGTGAAFRDMVHVLKRRFPALPILLYPVPVQGDEAAPAIVQAIAKANELKNCDVLIVGRGGGSLEDLWAFNEEQVALAIAASEIPIVSAVGHQTDFTISDFVADLRAPTPSAAAELISPDQIEWLQTITSYEDYFESKMLQLISQLQQQVIHLSKRLRNPSRELEEAAQKIDQLEIRLKKSVHLKLDGKKERLTNSSIRLLNQNPQKSLPLFSRSIASLTQRLTQAQSRLIERQQLKFTSLAQRLDSISPLQTIARGYSITRNEKNELVTNCEQVAKNDVLSIQVKDGTINSQVVNIKKDSV